VQTGNAGTGVTAVWLRYQVSQWTMLSIGIRFAGLKSVPMV